MTNKEPVTILTDDINKHPAARVWWQIDGGQSIPQRIEVLKQQEKASVYRLQGRMPSEWTIIAKCCLSKTGRLERVVYEEILPLLPVSSLQYHGSPTETVSEVWLFLEDAGTRRFSIADESHRILAARWLGTLHSSSPHTSAAQLLPERDPAYYLELMQKGREYIVRSLANPAMRIPDLDLLRRILRQMDALESNWLELLRICKAIPQTLIHGDFQPKNIYVKQTSSGDVLYVIDWEMAGWGIPVVDIAPSRGFSTDTQVDLPVYLSSVQEFWRELDLPTLKYYVHVGVILRRLAALYWSSLELPYLWVEKPILSMEIYYKDLANAMLGVFGKELANSGRA